MKKIMKTLTIVIGCAMTMAVLTACSDNTDNPAPKPEQESQAEYTIMFYTAGARNIDPCWLLGMKVRVNLLQQRIPYSFRQ